MPILLTIEHKSGDGHPDVMFWCPGCKCGHGVWVSGKTPSGATWTFNGNMLKPTFTPSILTRTHEWTPPVTPDNMEAFKSKPWSQTKVEKVCHLNINDGIITFHRDSTHEFSGRVVPMEDFDKCQSI